MEDIPFLLSYVSYLVSILNTSKRTACVISELYQQYTEYQTIREHFNSDYNPINIELWQCGILQKIKIDHSTDNRNSINISALF